LRSCDVAMLAPIAPVLSPSPRATFVDCPDRIPDCEQKPALGWSELLNWHVYAARCPDEQPQTCPRVASGSPLQPSINSLILLLRSVWFAESRHLCEQRATQSFSFVFVEPQCRARYASTARQIKYRGSTARVCIEQYRATKWVTCD